MTTQYNLNYCACHCYWEVSHKKWLIDQPSQCIYKKKKQLQDQKNSGTDVENIYVYNDEMQFLPNFMIQDKLQTAWKIQLTAKWSC